MKTVLIVAGVILLAAAAVLLACTKALNQLAREEDLQIRSQIEDDRLSCGLIEED